MAARCTTPPVAMHHSSGNDAPSSAVRLHCWGGVRTQLAEKEGINEQLKSQDQIAWVGAMNSIRNRAEEIILQELIYREDAV